MYSFFSSNNYMKYILNIKMLLLYASRAAENNIWIWWLFSTQENFYEQSKNWQVNLSVKLVLELRNLHFFFKFQCILNQSNKYFQLDNSIVKTSGDGYESDAKMTEEMVIEILDQLQLILQYSCSS